MNRRAFLGCMPAARAAAAAWPAEPDPIASRPEIMLDLDGQPAAPEGIDDLTDGVRYRYQGGLAAEGRRTRSGDAVEWQWSLRNGGVAPSRAVTRFRPLVLRLRCNGRHAPFLHGSRGGLDDANYPPESWTQWTRSAVTEGLANAFRASSAGGRSSNRDFPAFVVENADRSGGILAAVGWSGDWDLRMQRREETVVIDAGMTNLRLSLRPGESFRQPGILMGEYKGEAASGQRAIRRHIRDRLQPKLAGKPMQPVTFFDNYYGDRGNWTGQDFLDEIPLAEQAGIEYLVLDGGWTGGGWDAKFQSLLPHIGSWIPDPKKFPEGFAPLVRSAQKHSRKLGIWFDIERAHTDSLSYRQHQELFSPQEAQGCHLLRLEKQSALDWALSTMSGVVQDLDAGWVRFDFNSDPAPIWAASDGENRRGETEIRYLENLYRLMDGLLERFPGTIIENCASGGRRIDLETLRRSHTNWVSDHTQAESVIRYHVHGCARWLPANQINTSMAHAFLEPNRPVNWKDALPASAYLSHFGGNFSISDRLKPLRPGGLAAMRRFVEAFRRSAASFAGDVYPVGAQHAVLEGPAGIAGVDETTGRRALVLFGTQPGRVPQGSIPDRFRSLIERSPAAGDAGSDQFVPAWLWYD